MTYISFPLFVFDNGLSGKTHWDTGQEPKIPSYAIAVSIAFTTAKESEWHSTWWMEFVSTATGSDKYVLIMSSIAHTLILNMSLINLLHCHLPSTRSMSPTASMLTQWQECAGLSCTLNWYTVLFWMLWTSVWFVELHTPNHQKQKKPTITITWQQNKTNCLAMYAAVNCMPNVTRFQYFHVLYNNVYTKDWIQCITLNYKLFAFIIMLTQCHIM